MEYKYNFTQEEFEALTAAKMHFEDAVKRNMKHNSPRWLDERVRMIYEHVAGPQLINMNCAQCVFTLYQQCGRLYFKDKIMHEVEEQEKQKQLEENKIDNSIESPVEVETNDTDSNAEVEEPDTTAAPAEAEQPTLATEPAIEEPQTPETVEVEQPATDVKQVEPAPKKRGRKPKNNTAVAKE